MTNTELAALAYRAGFGEKAENQIRIEDFVKLKQFAEAVLAKHKSVQVSPLEFMMRVTDREETKGEPVFWAEWPTKEKNA